MSRFQPRQLCKRALMFAGRKAQQPDAMVRGLRMRRVRPTRGRCLVSYNHHFVRHLKRIVGAGGWDGRVLAAMQRHVWDPIPGARAGRTFASHSAFWESAEMVRQCAQRGFIVDVIDERRGSLLTRELGRYDFIIDEWNNLQTWTRINPRAKTWYYASVPHWIAHNQAVLERHAWLLARRGIMVKTIKQLPPIFGLEDADLITSFGNAVVNQRFAHVRPKLRQLQYLVVDDDIVLPPKDWEAARRTFLYFAGAGWVHKGLDLAVEAFLQELDFTLHVVGSMANTDPDFAKSYGEAIAKAGNIIVHPWVDIRSEVFKALLHRCGAIVAPSASENCSGATLQAMHYGLIPIAGHTVGTWNDLWPALTGQTDLELIAQIRAQCQVIAQRSPVELEEQRRMAWHYVRTHHTRQAYRESLSRVLDEWMGLAPSAAELPAEMLVPAKAG